MSIFNKAIFTTFISTIAVTSAMACPVERNIYGNDGISINHYSGNNVDAYYINDGKSRSLTVKTPGNSLGPQWTIDCDENRIDCINALRSVDEGHTPARPPSAVGDDVEPTPPHDEPSEGSTGPSEPAPDANAHTNAEKLINSVKYDRSKTVVNTDCSIIKENIKQYQWELIKLEYSQKSKYTK